MSYAIKSLEDELGCGLFRRVGRRAALLPAGERFLHYCEEILAKMQDARSDMNQLQELTRPVLRVGAPVTVCQHLLPSVLQHVQKADPRLSLRVETGDSLQLLAFLLAGRIDLAVMVEPEKRPDLALEHLFSDEMQFVMMPSHPWAEGREISDEEIRETTLILPSKGSRSFQLIMAHFRESRTTLGQTIELGSVDSIKKLVMKSLGVGVVATWVIRDEIESGKLVGRSLGRRPLLRRWYAARLKERELAPAETNLVSILRREARRFEEGPLAPGLLAELQS